MIELGADSAQQEEAARQELGAGVNVIMSKLEKSGLNKSVPLTQSRQAASNISVAGETAADSIKTKLEANNSRPEELDS